MSRAELQYLSDTLLIEEVAALEFGLTKQAGLFDSLNLSSIGSSIKSFVSEHVKSDAPGGYVGSVLSLMAPAVLWRINPFVGIIYLIASQFGFDIQGIVSKIVDALKPKLMSGQQVTSEEVNSIGKSIVGSQVSEAAPDDMFEPLRKLSQNGKLQTMAAGDSLDALRGLLGGGGPGTGVPKTPFLSGGGGSVLQKVFGTLFNLPGRGKGKWLLGGFVIWIIKTVLAGAGLLAGAEAVSGLLGHKKPPTATAPKTPESGSTYSQKPGETQKPEEYSLPPGAESKLPQAASNELWVVPLVGNGTVEDTLATWALDLYPNLDKYDNIKQTIESSSAFGATAALLKKDPRKIGPSSLVMPSEFSSRKQVVDTFIDDVIRSLG
ncbi:MAG TPA: hypothetical protein VM577_14140 [Anaerovoracaceae bacterium]|nr:hypothetical protein [Anaerovoracaceae bacterium]